MFHFQIYRTMRIKYDCERSTLQSCNMNLKLLNTGQLYLYIFLLWGVFKLAFRLLLLFCLFRMNINLFCLRLLVALDVQWQPSKSCNMYKHQHLLTLSVIQQQNPQDKSTYFTNKCSYSLDENDTCTWGKRMDKDIQWGVNYFPFQSHYDEMDKVCNMKKKWICKLTKTRPFGRYRVRWCNNNKNKYWRNRPSREKLG